MATLTLDQSQLWCETYGQGIGYTGTYLEAQGFTPSVSGTLNSISLCVSCSAGSQPDLVVGIYKTLAGVPTGSALATQTILGIDAPFSSSGAYAPMLNVTFSSPPSLTAGVVYAIVLSCAYAAIAYRWFSTIHNIYSGGTASYSSNGGSSWSTDPTYSKAFVTSMSTAVATPGLDQFMFGGTRGSASYDQVALAGAWRAQTFIPSISNILSKVRLGITRQDAQTAGTITIQTVNGSYKPTGTVLATATIADTAIPTVASVSVLLDVTFSTPASLTSGTTYAIVYQFNNVDSTHRYNICNSYNTWDSYTRGTRWDSTDSGSTWAVKNSNCDMLFGTFMLEPATVTQTIEADATINVVSTQTVTSNAFCGEETAKTINSDSKIINILSRTINADAFVILVASKTIDTDAIILGTAERIISSDASIQVTALQTVQSSAFCGEETIRTITAGGSVGNSVNQDITSDAFCGEETTQLIDTDAHVLATSEATVDTDAHVLATTIQAINADTTILETSSRVLASDAVILSTAQFSIYADSKVVLITERTILAAANIFAVISRTICAQASIAIAITQTVDSEAVICRPEPRIQLYVVV